MHVRLCVYSSERLFVLPDFRRSRYSEFRICVCSVFASGLGALGSKPLNLNQNRLEGTLLEQNDLSLFCHL